MGETAIAVIGMTVVCIVSIPTFLRSWHGRGSQSLPPVGPWRLIKDPKARSRALPAILLSGYVLCSAGWFVVVTGSGPGTSTVSILAGGFVALAWLASILGVVSVVLLNRPKFLVPPYARNQWGSLRTRKHRG